MESDHDTKAVAQNRLKLFDNQIKTTLLTTKEAAIALRMTESFMRARVHRAKNNLDEHPIPYRKVGRSIRFAIHELEEWIAHLTEGNNVNSITKR